MVLALMGYNPFEHAPPKYIKIDLYQYEFSSVKEPDRKYWKRTFVQPYLPPLDVQNSSLLTYLKQYGWL